MAQSRYRFSAGLRFALAALAVGSAALAAPSLVAANPACEATVTDDVTLTGNMNCPEGFGIVVGASGITIDLNGFTLSGPGTGDTPYGNGVFDVGYDNVTVENGTVTNFTTGVVEENMTGPRILNVNASGNGVGIDVGGAKDGTINHSTASHNDTNGFQFSGNTRVTLANSTATYNEVGVFDQYSHADSLDSVSANHNTKWGVEIINPLAIRTPKGKNYYLIRDSTANRNSASGVAIFAEGGYNTRFQVKLVGNTANHNGALGFVADLPEKAKHNHASGNAPHQCYPLSLCN